jgi:hypothetical protein
VGLVCNLLIRPVHARHHMSEEERRREQAGQPADASDHAAAARGGFGLIGVLAWAAVGVPFAIGLLIALQKAAALL